MNKVFKRENKDIRNNHMIYYIISFIILNSYSFSIHVHLNFT